MIAKIVKGSGFREVTGYIIDSLPLRFMKRIGNLSAGTLISCGRSL